METKTYGKTKPLGKTKNLLKKPMDNKNLWRKTY